MASQAQAQTPQTPSQAASQAATQAPSHAQAQALVVAWLKTKESAKKTESEEEAAKRKELKERQTALRHEILSALQAAELDAGMVDLGGGDIKHVYIQHDSRPRPVTVDVARAAISTSLTVSTLRTMMKDWIATDNKKPLIELLDSAMTETINDIVAHDVDRAVVADTPKHKAGSKKRPRGADDYLAPAVQKKVKQYLEVTRALEELVQAQAKPSDAEPSAKRKALKTAEEGLCDFLAKTNVPFNYMRSVDGATKYFHVKLVETVEIKHVTKTASKAVVRSTLENVFAKLKIKEGTQMTKQITDDVLQQLQKEIEELLVADIIAYERDNAKVSRKLHVGDGRG